MVSATRRLQDADSCYEQLETGHPLHLPAATGFSATGRDVHLDYLPTGVEYTPFTLPVFTIDEKTIPSRATQLLYEWQVKNPYDIIDTPAALMATLRWIWIMEDPKIRPDNITERLAAQMGGRDYISLEDWLRCAHQYEAFHQQHRLVSYIHPRRFVTHVMTQRGILTAEQPEPSPNRTLEELVTILRCLVQQPLGMVLPCFHRGSSKSGLSPTKTPWIPGKFMPPKTWEVVDRFTKGYQEEIGSINDVENGPPPDMEALL